MTLPGARDRVERLLDAALAIRDDHGIVDPVVASTGLSRQGVALGLARYLEWDAPRDELARLLEASASASSVRVILSANVFVAPLRALAVACATSPRVSVKPSRRDPVIARELVRRAPELRITLLDEADVASVGDGEVHVYGRDETVREVRRAARPGVRVRGHGAGMGVALVTETADLAAAASALSTDVVAFDQRGCLSPRVAFVLGDYTRALAFGGELASALSDWEESVPRGRLFEDEAREGARYAETARFAGRLFEGHGYVVGVAEGGALLVPPTGRHVHIVPVTDPCAAREAVAPLRERIVAIGTDDPERALGLAPRARLSPLGSMQKPPFDGPVDLRGG